MIVLTKIILDNKEFPQKLKFSLGVTFINISIDFYMTNYVSKNSFKL